MGTGASPPDRHVGDHAGPVRPTSGAVASANGDDPRSAVQPRANPGLGGAINLAATDDAPELLLSDGLVEDQLSQDPVVVRKARATFNNVRADALNRADSRRVLVEAMERWSN